MGRNGSVEENEVRTRGSFRTLVDCFELRVSRRPRERFGELIAEVLRVLGERPESVWCFKGTSDEVTAIESAFRSPRRRSQFIVRTRGGRTELYIRLRPVPPTRGAE